MPYNGATTLYNFHYRLSFSLDELFTLISVIRWKSLLIRYWDVDAYHFITYYHMATILRSMPMIIIYLNEYFDTDI